MNRHIELDGDRHGPKGRELLDDLVAKAAEKGERARRAACNSIKARIGLWNSILKLIERGRQPTQPIA